MSSHETPCHDPLKVLEQHVTDRGLRMTRQRRTIAEVVLREDGHLNIDELYSAVRKVDKGIGYATLYRTLKLLTECGLVVSSHFGDGAMRFESAVNRTHHDHLVCVECGNIIEFENEQIEALQEEVCRSNNFKVTHHSLEIYGHCANCN